MLKRRFRMYVNTGFRYERGEISKAIFDLDRSSGKKIVAPKL